MKPILTVEFSAKSGDSEFKEESVPLHSPEEFFKFVAPNGGCERIPDDVAEIRMVFLPPDHRNVNNPIADTPVTLQIGMVFFNGPLNEILQTLQQMVDKAGRGELSEAFCRVIGITTSTG